MRTVSIAIPTACFLAAAAFMVSMIAGLGSENTISSILERALFALFLTWPIGFFIGKIVESLFVQQDAEATTEEPEVPVDAGDAASDPGQRELDEDTSESEGRGSVPPPQEAVLTAATPP